MFRTGIRALCCVCVVWVCQSTTTTHVGGREVSGDIFQVSSRSLSVPGQFAEHKCHREIPAILSQTHKHERVQGNGSSIYYHRIEVCCDGYRRYKYNWQQCVPECSSTSPDNCHNGFCREPQQCECYDEFVRNDRGVCINTCPIACQHGHCQLDGTCNCEPGYALDLSTRKFCRPECERNMCGTNQVCIAPERCACKEGYRMAGELGCQPICTPDCGHGKCVGPNRCECFAGFMKRPHRNVCEAECYMRCDNGFCKSRYVCQCHEGFVYDTNTTSCLPDCGDACENGACVQPGICRCYKGYQLLHGRCQPICEGGCGPHGSCIEGQLCACGHVPHHCVDGRCQSNGICACGHGYTYFVDGCIDAGNVTHVVGTHERRVHYNAQLRREFRTLIGRFFDY